MKRGPLRLDAAERASILVLKPSSLGDVVHTLPAVHAFRGAFPKAALRWIVNTEWAPLLAGNPDLDEVIEFPRSRFRSLARTPAFFGWLQGLRHLRPDLALDFQGLFRTAVFARAAGAAHIHCLSNAELINRLSATRVVPMRWDEHAVDRYLRLVADLGVDRPAALEFPLPAGTRPAANLPDAPCLLVHPFSRGQGKSLSPEILRELCQELSDIPIVIVGRSEMTFGAPATAFNLLNATSLQELIWLIRHARFVLSVDSGPMHIAAAITSRLLSIHTWSNPLLVGPYAPEAWIWKNGAIFQRKEMPAEVTAGGADFSRTDLPVLTKFLRQQFLE